MGVSGYTLPEALEGLSGRVVWMELVGPKWAPEELDGQLWTLAPSGWPRRFARVTPLEVAERRPRWGLALLSRLAAVSAEE